MPTELMDFQTRIESFWLKVKKGNPFRCWEWQAAKLEKGYGKFRLGKKMVFAHILCYQIHYGPIPEGMLVLHECDNPSCCNPNHLFLGTHKDNSDDMIAKGRSKHPSGSNHCRAILSEEDVLDMRAIYQNGGISQVQLANLFGVGKSTVYAALSGENWRCIE